MDRFTESYGSMVFGDKTMQKWLSPDVYRRLRNTIDGNNALEPDIADEVAKAMKDWAISLGATHYTHWFQPMTGSTAEKHDSFLSHGPNGYILDFSGKELIKGESDASSLPNGGIRATFEARGYTAWDATSYAFIKENTLCIPTAFCSFGGEALDKKTPLLRSMELISAQALRLLHLFGHTEVSKVFPTVGAEQEYFIIDKALYEKRKDLIFTGRTLFGAKPPKGQELDDHYYGSIKPRIKAFMEELDDELWKLGIPAKTEHNEVAPSQHELAVLFTTANLATDNNQLLMETMKKVADRHQLTCLLHEKPFAGLNGSGKHNNWSLSTDTGVNLLEPGETPFENAQFLLFLCAVIRAVDIHQDLLRISVASASNDHRLGANEAPPAILSMFLGEELTSILEAFARERGYEKKEKKVMRIGVTTLPKFPLDSTDRNRTSPFAFTGNKFEFRMPGSSFSIADINTVLNTIVAESLDAMATALENSADFEDTVHLLIQNTVSEHRRIIFNGNNYAEEWVKEAEKRGLYNLKTTPEALEKLVSEENLSLFSHYHILSQTELRARYEIMLENYCKTIHIEALTMVQMARRDFVPAISAFTSDLAESVLRKKKVSSVNVKGEEHLLSHLSDLLSDICDRTDILEIMCNREKAERDTVLSQAQYAGSKVTEAMEGLRADVDEAETLTGNSYWPVPTYSDLLFSV